MMEHEKDLFNKVIDEQIQRVRNQQNLQFEIGVLEDLKRMAEIGCFTVYTALPNDFELKWLGVNNLKIECTVPRMFWTGEDTINKLIEENRRLKIEIQELKTP